MSEVSTRAWTRPHDWAEVVIGVVAALSPLWLSTDTMTMWTMVILGALIAIDGLVSLATPGAVYGEGIQIVLGVLLFIAPWVMGYTEFNGASWTSWVAGALTIIAGAAAMPMANAAHRTAMPH
ncbi:SPW repeat protein [Amycolatopsis rhabdoformis]|uniref:SPW repeat protein n=1 Tax=Amycolatopsis rhabdoformis TaxID=1448059 RepID=A0ABZ1I879_9PSEU|nr:SPW repeat protein [Amycolatopsis rhabdoformis]WSE30078.1 SPW repeat protein [Amycolatopsis rhabdoformis]